MFHYVFSNIIKGNYIMISIESALKLLDTKTSHGEIQ